MTDDVVRRYYSARPIQAPAQLLADAIHEVEILREKLARYKLTHEQYVEAIDRINGTPCEQIRHQQEVEALREEIARLRARICEADEMLFNQARTIQSYQDAAIRG